MLLALQQLALSSAGADHHPPLVKLCRALNSTETDVKGNFAKQSWCLSWTRGSL